MSDLQTCLASFAVAAGANNDSGVENVERQIDAYLAGLDDPISAVLALKSAFDTMRLDGQVALLIAARLDERLASLTPWSPPAAGDTSPEGSASEL